MDWKVPLRLSQSSKIRYCIVLEVLRGLFEPLQGYCTIVCDTCQVPLYDSERRMISNGDVSISEVIRGG